MELHEDNVEAQSLLWFSLHEHTRQLVPQLSERLLAHLPNIVAAAVIVRVGGALLSPRVVDALYPKQKTGKDATGGKAHTGKKMTKVQALRDPSAGERQKQAQLHGLGRGR